MPRAGQETNSVRRRRAALLNNIYSGVSNPVIKWADTIEEYEQVFKLVHDEYVRKGHLQPKASNLYFGIHQLLPSSKLAVIKEGTAVIASLCIAGDNEPFGLPSDSMHADELNSIRSEGGRAAEICTLVTAKKYRMSNIHMPFFREVATALYDEQDNITHVVSSVTAKHVPFYERILLFDLLGSEERRHPLLALSTRVLSIARASYRSLLRETCAGEAPHCSLFDFLFNPYAKLTPVRPEAKKELMPFFLSKDTVVLERLDPAKKAYLFDSYPSLRKLERRTFAPKVRGHVLVL